MKKTVIEARLSIPAGLAVRLKAMAAEREMTMNALLSQLVQVGEVSLRRDPPELQAGARPGEVDHSLRLPKRGR